MDEERNAHNDLDDELEDDDDNIDQDDVAGHPPASNARAFLDDIAQVGGNQLPVAARQRAQSTRPPQVTSEVLLPAHTHTRPIAAQIIAARDQARLHSSARRDVATRVPTSATEQRSARSASSLDVLKDYLNTAGSNANPALVQLILHSVFYPDETALRQALLTALVLQGCALHEAQHAVKPALVADVMKRLRERRGTKSNEIRKAFEYFYQLPMLYNGKPTAARLAQLAALKKAHTAAMDAENGVTSGSDVCCKKFGARSEKQLYCLCLHKGPAPAPHVDSPGDVELALDSEEEESEATPLRVAVTKEQLAFTVAVFLVNQTIQDKKDHVAYFNKVVQYVNNTHMDTLEIVNAPALPTVEGLPGGEGDLEDAEDFTI
eukprot:jgi/Chlat1/8610/Chrsp86S09234